MQGEEKIISLLQDDAAPELGQAAAKRIAASAAAEFIRTKPGSVGLFETLRMKLNEMSRIPFMVGSSAAVVLALFAVVWQFTHQPPVIALPQDGVERQKVLLAAFNEMFNGKLQAIVSVNGQTQLVLGENAVGKGTPVVINLTVGGQSVDIVSFSGQNVKVSVGGREVNFDALEDGRGGVILAGDKFLWTSRPGENIPAPGMEINAQLLEM